MGSHWGRIINEEASNYKGFNEYKKCQSEVFAYSSILLVASSGLTFSLLNHKTFKRVPLKNRVLSSFLFGVFSAWYFARVRTRYCQELWMVLDDKLPKQNEKKLEEFEPED